MIMAMYINSENKGISNNSCRTVYPTKYLDA